MTTSYVNKLGYEYSFTDTNVMKVVSPNISPVYHYMYLLIYGGGVILITVHLIRSHLRLHLRWFKIKNASMSPLNTGINVVYKAKQLYVFSFILFMHQILSFLLQIIKKSSSLPLCDIRCTRISLACVCFTKNSVFSPLMSHVWHSSFFDVHCCLLEIKVESEEHNKFFKWKKLYINRMAARLQKNYIHEFSLEGRLVQLITTFNLNLKI